jgi:2-dehydro-3-deoxyphosphogluconate aldolase/(4S)-4-hydroxy-2-oxoglutarate aldolase
MMLDDIMRLAPVIPVLVIERERHAVPLARALVAGGLRALEVTLRTPVALDCIRRIGAEVEGAVVGAGTVLSVKDLEACAGVGARFAVSPGLTEELAQARAGLPLLPGVATPSEAMRAAEHGLTRLKFFPAVPNGGVAVLKAWAGPLPRLKFCPTGGVTPGNAREFLALPNVACVGGSWMVPPGAVEGERWAEITALAREAAALRG